ncbi:trp operon repressor [Alphaproteobacteria bacterium]|nr:trp operon repressor [Alphaproteobacteria bacterium]
MKAKLLHKILLETNEVQTMSLLMKALFTTKELKELENRLKIFQLLIKGETQREISELLNVGIATVTRGANTYETESIFKINSNIIETLKKNKFDKND